MPAYLLGLVAWVLMSEVTTAGLLDQIYYSGGSTVERGSRFERLVKRYLELDPPYAQRFSEVIPWGEWEDRTGQDVGIDLVGIEADGSGVCAIQCKFYDPDHTLSKEGIDSFLAASGKYPFTSRLIVSTTEKWGKNAELMMEDQQIPVSRIGLQNLLDASIAWDKFDITTPEVLELTGRKELRKHQVKALEDVRQGFSERDRGQMIMACGTGKTFTSLKIAEDLVPVGGTVLFLVPSLALLSQALWDWTRESEDPLRVYAVCSDTQVGKKKQQSVDEDISAVDLAYPATTDGHALAASLKQAAPDQLTVVFATYQSIDVVHQAQQEGVGPFDLIISDEAHRTTGATLAGADESAFVRVHDNDYLQASKRLYMTATPRIYTPVAKAKSDDHAITLASMDDEEIFGPEFHRLGFGEAVSQKLLTDYKVITLTVSEDKVSELFQRTLETDGQLQLPDVAKIVGVWNAIAKRSIDPEDFRADPDPMRRVVAFARDIKTSKRFTESFTDVIGEYLELSDLEDADDAVLVETDHVDGSMNMLLREGKMGWLKHPDGDLTARVLSNARCLSEGVDVPTLDGVAFLSPRKSQVDVVQSVGRVMRLAPGKEYGYIILPIAIPAGMTPEEALNKSEAYQVVWEVLQALRSHDERFDAMINQIELNKKKPERTIFGQAPMPGDEDTGGQDSAGMQVDPGVQTLIDLGALTGWKEAIYAKLVQKVGNTRYWETWAKDIAQIAKRHRTRLADQVVRPEVAVEFAAFHAALQANLNEGITAEDAVDMLSQHLITKPVFDALFSGYDFTVQNPVAQVMEGMLQTLDEGNLEAETESLEKFYTSVHERAAGIDNAAGRQQVAIELYEKFFRLAFEKTAKSLGIAYTPVKVVDFILRATNTLLEEHFNTTISHEGIHVLDPFTGTGTFIVRLIQSGLIKPHDLARKYARELHANEIMLLAYYIAAVNIEAAYQEKMKEDGHSVSYTPFNGIVLADTFQAAEDLGKLDKVFFQTNNARAEEQSKLDIRVIIGNPPYSVGQTSSNDENPNQAYPKLDYQIRRTYVDTSTSGRNKNSLYDSYIRAIRWASDRIKDKGIIAYITNNGFIDSNVADGLRKTLQDEFTHIYIYNLRGNSRMAGERARKEGGNVFDVRVGITITFLIKTPHTAPSRHINYYQVDDYLTKEDKLTLVENAQITAVPWQQIAPNDHNDWLNQRSDIFPTWQPIGGADTKNGIFQLRSGGVKTNRDAWMYSSNREVLEGRVQEMVTYYNDCAEDRTLPSPLDSTKFNWNRADKTKVTRGDKLQYDPERIYTATYRPFFKQHLYFDRTMNDMVYQQNRIFPLPQSENIGFYQVGSGSAVPFSVLMTNTLPDLHVTGAGSGGQYFPRYTYHPVEEGLPIGEEHDGYYREDNITDTTLHDYRNSYGNQVTKDEIFYYVYGILHSPQYRHEYAADLKKLFPHIPKVASQEGFHAYVEAGRKLADLHINYERAPLYPLTIEEGLAGDADAYEHYQVTKMRYPRIRGKVDNTQIQYNPHIRISGIPAEVHDYKLGSRSALDWILDRYKITTDKASGIMNDPNDWAKEVGNPRYVLELVQQVTSVSLSTKRIVEDLPPLTAN